MPDNIRGNRIGVQPSSSHIFAYINAEMAGRIGDEWFDCSRLDEEAVVADGRDLAPKVNGVSPSTWDVVPSIQVRVSVSFPQPPAERVIRSQKRKVAIKRRIRTDIGVAACIGTDNSWVFCRLAHGREEVRPDEDIICAEESDDGALCTLDAIGFRFLRVPLVLEEDFHVLLREALEVNGSQQLLEPRFIALRARNH